MYTTYCNLNFLNFCFMKLSDIEALGGTQEDIELLLDILSDDDNEKTVPATKTEKKIPKEKIDVIVSLQLL